MQFHIHHNTQYTYSRPVFIEPHIVRLRPRCDGSQSLDRYQIDVSPAPAGLAEGLDAENNACMQLWFDEMHDHFEIKINAEVTTLQTNPFRGLVDDRMDQLPLKGLDQRPVLKSYVTADDTQDLHEAVGDLVNDILDKTQGRILDFLNGLNNTLHQSIEKIVRTKPGIQSPQQTLSSGKGACRDLACLFIVASNQVGIPARFVSGYHLGDPDEPYNDLHAWAEVFIPGLGWRGYDPTHGLAAAERHIAIAASHTPAGAAPLTGTFRGTDATSKLTHAIQIKTY